MFNDSERGREHQVSVIAHDAHRAVLQHYKRSDLQSCRFRPGCILALMTTMLVCLLLVRHFADYCHICQCCEPQDTYSQSSGDGHLPLPPVSDRDTLQLSPSRQMPVESSAPFTTEQTPAFVDEGIKCAALTGCKNFYNTEAERQRAMAARNQRPNRAFLTQPRAQPFHRPDFNITKSSEEST